MESQGDSDAVFIRSVSSRGHLGGLSRTAGRIIDLFDAAGFDFVIVETVGTGQSEVEIARFADTNVVVCPPGLGDEVQAIKAGILEIADLLVVNKGDLPAAARTAHDLQTAPILQHRDRWQVPVLRTVATRGEGIAALVERIEAPAAAALAAAAAAVAAAAATAPQASDDELLQRVQAWRAAGKGVALATVVRTWGSSPRAEGSHLAVEEGGGFVGSVSGGCVEGAVISEAMGVIAAGTPKLLEFGVSDEQAWDVGLACGGKVQVYVERIG
jgi:LAO/AO transport system ATPase